MDSPRNEAGPAADRGDMALPLLRWSCRRPALVLKSYLRVDRAVESRALSRRAAPWAPALGGERCYSSDPKRYQKVVVLGIPNPLIWIRTRVYYFLIRTYFDKEFSIDEFSEGARQVTHPPSVQSGIKYTHHKVTLS